MHRIGATIAILAASAGCKHPTGDLPCEPELSRAADGPPLLDLVAVDKERSEMAEGFVVTNQSDGDQSWATVIDGCAAHVWWRPPSDPAARVYRAHRSLDGSRVLFAEHNRDHRPDIGRLLEVDIASDKVVRETRIIEGHHDFAQLDRNSVAWIGWQYLENQWFPNLDADVVTDTVRTATLGTVKETDDRLFSLYDTLRLQPWWVCNHMAPTEQIPGYAEWSHSNSLMYEPVQDRLYLYARFWDALVAMDRHGQPLWTMGGPNSDFEVAPGTELPMHAHLSEVWDGGMLVYDNRNHHPSGTSRVVELAWDEDSRTVEEVWSYDDGTFGAFLGDARRLPGGNVLIFYSTQGRLTEVTRSGEVVWEAIVEGEDARLSRGDFHASWP